MGTLPATNFLRDLHNRRWTSAEMIVWNDAKTSLLCANLWMVCNESKAVKAAARCLSYLWSAKWDQQYSKMVSSELGCPWLL
jgi:hypothetical protein